MPKRTIIEVNERLGDEEEWYLTYEDGWGVDEEYRTPDRMRTPIGGLSLEELADFCDGNAESRNNHDYVGTHRILAAILHQKVGREQAMALLLEIAEYGGLDGMSGVGGEADAFDEFGIEDCWHEWKLS